MKLANVAFAVLALVSLSPAIAGNAAPPSEATSARTRAEVRAETLMWVRSGMSDIEPSETYDPVSPESIKARATFAQLMKGPEYAIELKHQIQLLQEPAAASVAHVSSGR